MMNPSPISVSAGSIGLNRVDGLEPLAQVRANTQVVVLVHREVHGIEVAHVAKPLVEADDARCVAFAPLVCVQIDFRDEESVGFPFHFAARVADEAVFARLVVDEEPILVFAVANVADKRHEALELLDHVVGLVLADERRPVFVPDLVGHGRKLLDLIFCSDGFESHGHLPLVRVPFCRVSVL